LKCAAVHFGVGRYLYALDRRCIQGNTLTPAMKAALRAKLAKPDRYVAPELLAYARDTEPQSTTSNEAHEA
jgi:hypothetical protein